MDHRAPRYLARGLPKSGVCGSSIELCISDQIIVNVSLLVKNVPDLSVVAKVLYRRDGVINSNDAAALLTI